MTYTTTTGNLARRGCPTCFYIFGFFNLVNILKKTSFKEELHKCSSSREAAELIVKYEYQL